MTRLIALGLGAALVVILFFKIVLDVVSMLSTNRATQIAAIANAKYGVIDEPVLNDEQVRASAVNLSLDLVNGSFPESSPSARVYKVATPSLSLTAQDRARAKAANLGLTTEPDQSDSSQLVWQQDNRTLTIVLQDQSINLTTKDAAKINLTGLQSFTRSSPIARFTSALMQKQLLFNDLDYAQPIVRFVNPVDDTYLPQPEDAAIPTSYAQVSFLRGKLDELPFYTAKGKLGPLTVILTPPANPPAGRTLTAYSASQIIDLQSTYLPIDKNDFATYPIISASTAYDLLKSNVTKALTSVEPVSVAAIPTTLTTARVLFASLVYLEPDKQNSDFVQPVWLFEGRGSTDVGEAQWKAMVPAIDAQKTDQLLKAKSK